MNIEQHIIGFSSEGEVVLRYVLTNENGMTVTLLNVGAAVESIISPDGFPLTITYPSYTNYMSDSLQMGKIVGRAAGRVAKGRVEMNDNIYKLTSNEGTTHLNGGVSSFGAKIWQARGEENMVVFSYLSPSNEEGYPAEFGVEVGYTLTEDNELCVTVIGESNGDTIVNIAPFIYFSLGNNREIKIFGKKIVDLGKKSLPLGSLSDVKDTIYDFSCYRSINEEYSDYWQIDPEDSSILKDICSLRSEEKTVEICVRSTQSMLFMDSCDEIEGCGFNNKGEELVDREGLLIVPLNVAYDNINRLLLKEGERYQHHTVYRFIFN